MYTHLTYFLAWNSSKFLIAIISQQHFTPGFKLSKVEKLSLPLKNEQFMTISYNWLLQYLPDNISTERLGKILTSIGLEVEAMEQYSLIKGGLDGLVVGEVISCEKHEGADKLKVTQVNVGSESHLQIVCGAANLAAGQKVVVATVGTTLHPTNGTDFDIKKAKIRGVESNGMLCAEDEIGLGSSHDGIMVLDNQIAVGTAVSSLYENYEDVIFEIGLTPNRMDAMSHRGVARDVMAYLNHHNKSNLCLAEPKNISIDKSLPVLVNVTIANEEKCSRYCGVSINDIQVKESPAWLKQKLQAIGVQAINNIVDITNYILHDTGQPLHAFDASRISDNLIKVQTLTSGTVFTSLDGKERKLTAEDLMICDGEDRPMCMAGVYGGMGSGVSSNTKNIFLESAWFSPITVRKSSMQHGLRTDAATRFEKGVDISKTFTVLQQAAAMIVEVCGGKIASQFIDNYPVPAEQKEIILKYHYLKKLSGKNYHGDTVKNILTALGFTIQKDAADAITVIAPLSKPDISLPADVVEEIMRIDGLDNVVIPDVISIAPSSKVENHGFKIKEKLAGYLSGMGFNEIFTNSITNSKYYLEDVLASSVKMLNNLSADLDVMRPEMLQTGLEVIAYNINRKNSSLRFFENGKTYSQQKTGYKEPEHLALFVTGSMQEQGWAQKEKAIDFYDLKSICQSILQQAGIRNVDYKIAEQDHFSSAAMLTVKEKTIGFIAEVDAKTLSQFGIKQPVFYADLYWESIISLQQKNEVKYKPIPKFPAVQRDLALVVDKDLKYEAIEQLVAKSNISFLTQTKLFDVFESDKLGANKKSMAVNFTFQHPTKTLEEQEIEQMMKKLMLGFEKELSAEIRK